MKNKKVLLGMSGGVDSSVSAILLKEKGFEVIGITLQLFAGSCCNLETNLDAKNVCKSIGIPHITYDFRDEFKCRVIDDFIKEYSNQRTPNPCIECNKYLKFGAMYEKAQELGCSYIATGHYAKIEYSEKYQQMVLKKSNNIAKDQSYVLYSMPKELLEKVVFPLGEFETKDDIREIAKNANLKVANKPDSEDICFIPDGNYKKFLEENSNLQPKVGNIVTKTGEILGKHNGLYKYTIGQRKGLRISYKEPLFVIGFNTEKNELIVGTNTDTYKNEMFVDNLNWLLIDTLENKMKVKVKTRYSTKEANAEIEPIDKDVVKVVFEEPAQRITPGQSAVFYLDDIVVGGGKISERGL